MKHSSRSHGLLPLPLLLLLLLFVTVLSVCTTRASRLPSQIKLEGQDARVDDAAFLGDAAETEEKQSWEILELEKCEEEEDECLKRRMISEAHLDYIYTQRHKP